MIDLAGSERIFSHKDAFEISRQKEGAAINKSLLSLGNCIAGLASYQVHSKPMIPAYIPYRDSKLTRVLKDSLVDPKCAILLIVTLNPSVSQYDDTFNSLTFANKIKKIKVEQLQR